MSDTSISELISTRISRERIASALATARAVTKIPHHGTVGEIREILVRELFRPLLPPHFRVATGHLFDKTNRVSFQVDIIIFDRSLAPPIMFENLGLFPIECSLFVIEVKTKLTLAELKRSHKNALAISRFVYSRQPDNYPLTRYALFAFSSNLSKRHTVSCHYKKFYEGVGECPPPIRALCVVGREYGHEANGKWTGMPSDNLHNEVLLFVGGIVNSSREMAGRRSPIWMEDYLFPTNTEFRDLA
jgi:hypothetical protein